MTKELQDIHQNYKDSYISPDESRKKEWLDYLSQGSVSSLPVFWSQVETPTSVSYGGNVKFSELMTDAKRGYDLGLKNDVYVDGISSKLQDYTIGLCEDKKLINEQQASELVSMFQDKDSVKYFLENFEFPEKVNTLVAQEKEILKIEPFHKAEDFFIIEGGGAPEYDGQAGVGGLEALRKLFDETISIGLARSQAILQNSVSSDRGEDSKVSLGLLRKDQGVLKALDPKTYEGHWSGLVDLYNKETQFGSKDMGADKVGLVNRVFNDTITYVQGNCADRVIELRRQVDKSLPKNSFKGKDLGSNGMGMGM